MGTYTGQERSNRNSVCTAGASWQPSPMVPASQNHSVVSTSHINAMQQCGYSMPLDTGESIYDIHVSPPPSAQVKASTELEPFDGFDNDDFLLALNRGRMEEGLTNMDGITPFTTSQAHESGFYGYTSPPQRSQNYFIDTEPSSPTQPSTFNYPIFVPSSGDNLDGPGQLINPPILDPPNVALSRSTVTSTKSKAFSPNDSKVKPSNSKAVKSKKSHHCLVPTCVKSFGRSAELNRHMISVHRDYIATEKRGQLLSCTHEGCQRVGENGFKRKDNLVQHLRGVHGDVIVKKQSRRSPSAEGNQQQAGLFDHNQQAIVQEVGLSPPNLAEFFESLRFQNYEGYEGYEG
ncbi:hypothetical protein L873DRAFT_1788374 [Choiromyces venosus 120613-1]|uniref:C2H2-type domain-containing protein n=1 Tax=Choiromyces venosus 120613-1 TaxID=1336337 RepID=A0A3N4JSI5_9PEZI|nr:hypothetical protein L873DRAFT_1788374 [Choiromyces venosus 120613-1]